MFVTSRMPSMWSSSYWVSRGFNAAMHVRNALWSPPFVMYYLTFLLPEATEYLEDAGFEVRIVDEMLERLVLVDASLD